MPENTIKVDRTTRWGNPCVVGLHGTREECVKWFALALAGKYVMGYKNPDGTWLTDKLRAYVAMVRRDKRFLHGKNLACWCPLDKPCHADALLHIGANYGRKRKLALDLDKLLGKGKES